MIEMQLKFLAVTYCMIYVLPVLSWPLQSIDVRETSNAKNSSFRQFPLKDNDTFLANTTDTLVFSTAQTEQEIVLPTTFKPRNARVSTEEESSQEPLTTAAQNYFTSYYQPHLQPLGHSRPYYHGTEEPFIPKYFTQPRHNKFHQRPRLQTYTAYDSTLMGSGDFGVLRGGTFYSNEDASDHQEDNTDFYYNAGSDAHIASVTEAFIQKYTYPEEQFAQFRDFAELNTPADAAFSEYVVVYAAKNSTSETDRKVPNNIFDQLQQIDEENAEEAKKRRKRVKGLSSTKLKLIKTKVIKKKLNNKPKKDVDDDPLLALS